MTLKEAVDQLIATDQNRSYFVGKTERYMTRDKSIATDYRISFLPGIMCKCTLVDAISVEACLAEAQRLLNPPVIPSTPNEE